MSWWRERSHGASSEGLPPPTRIPPGVFHYADGVSCGGDITAHRAFDGITIPSAGTLGWFYGTDRWPDGEFFRYEITALRLDR
jgi:hypothetical protein